MGYFASFLGVIPVWFYALHRARRYVLARTRWRGVRFGLEKYKTDRTYFGSAKLVQGGRWPMLYRAAIPFAVAVLMSGLIVVWLVWLDPLIPNSANPFGDIFSELESAEEFGFALFGWDRPMRLLLLIPASVLLIYGAVHYRFVTKRILADHKHSDGVRLHSSLNGLRVSMIYVLGTTIAYSILVVGLLAIVLLVFGLLGPEAFLDEQLGMGDPLGDFPKWLAIGIIAVSYLSLFLFWGVLHHVFVTFPLMRHMALTLSLHNVAGLAQVSQRARRIRRGRRICRGSGSGSRDMTTPPNLPEASDGLSGNGRVYSGLNSSYFDGDAPVSHAVTLLVDNVAQVLEIGLPGSAQPGVRWPVDAIRQLDDTAGSEWVILRWTGDPLARLHLADPDLLRHLPHLNRRAPPKGRGRLAAWALAAVAGVAIQIGILVPLLADRLATFVPPRGRTCAGRGDV